MVSEENSEQAMQRGRLQVTCLKGHLSEGSFVRNVVLQIPKFDAKPNPSSNPNPISNPNSNPNPMPIRFGQMTLRTSELLPTRNADILA